MDINEIRTHEFYQYEKYSYQRYYKKRDIMRQVSFDSYTEFIHNVRGFANSKHQYITIEHSICINGKIFKVSGDLPSTALIHTDDAENLFDINFTLDRYFDVKELTIEKYILKIKLSEFLSD